MASKILDSSFGFLMYVSSYLLMSVTDVITYLYVQLSEVIWTSFEQNEKGKEINLVNKTFTWWGMWLACLLTNLLLGDWFLPGI